MMKNKWVFILFAIGLCIFALTGCDDGKIEMPTVVGKNYIDVTNQLTELGFLVTTQEEFRTEFENQSVFETSLESGERYEIGTSVNIIFANYAMVLDVEGDNYSEARALFMKEGFEVDYDYSYDPDLEQFAVMGSSLGIGSKHQIGTSIVLTVNDFATVPDVVGEFSRDYGAALVDFEVAVEYVYTGNHGENKVIEQSLEPGMIYPIGTPIVVQIEKSALTHECVGQNWLWATEFLKELGFEIEYVDLVDPYCTNANMVVDMFPKADQRVAYGSTIRLTRMIRDEEVVEFKDEILREAVRMALDELGIIVEGDTFTKEDVLQIKQLNLEDNELTSLVGLDECYNLVKLDLSNCDLGNEDICYLRPLYNLLTLDLSDNNISETQPLNQISNLKYIDISNNSIKYQKNIDLIMADKVIYEGNPIRENETEIVSTKTVITFHDSIFEQVVRELVGDTDDEVLESELQGFTSLEIEYDMPISDLYGINFFKNLETLIVHQYTGRGYIYLPFGLKNLTIHNAKFDDIMTSGIQSFDLEYLNLSDCEMTVGIGCWVDLADSITILELENCGLNDISILEQYEKLEYLNIANNNIDDLSPLKNLSIKYLDITNNPIKDYSILEDMDIDQIIGCDMD